MALHSRTINVKDYDELRDILPTSGVFDMTDCAIEIWCPEVAQTGEIEKMSSLIESMLHVTDIKVGSGIEDLVSDSYRIVFLEDNRHNKARFNREGKK